MTNTKSEEVADAPELTNKQLNAKLAEEQTLRMAAEKDAEKYQEQARKAQKKVEAAEPNTQVDVEREIRKYIKRSGGYRKNLPEAAKKRCAHFLRKRGLKDEKGFPLKWDTSITVPGIDSPTVAAYAFDTETGQMKSTRG